MEPSADWGTGELQRQERELIKKLASFPDEIAEAAMYLASEAAAYVTGHTLVIDGGWTAR